MKHLDLVWLGCNRRHIYRVFSHLYCELSKCKILLKIVRIAGQRKELCNSYLIEMTEVALKVNKPLNVNLFKIFHLMYQIP